MTKVETMLAVEGIVLKYNDFTGRIMISVEGGPLHDIQDMDWYTMKYAIHTSGIKMPAGMFEPTIYVIANKAENHFHPVRDYLEGLKWDGKSRIGTWLIDYMEADDTPYVRTVGKLVLIAGVRRIMQPGCKFDELLALTGKEGIGKSLAVQALVPNRDWFTDSLPLGDEPKETVEKTTGIWIVEASELIGTSRTSVAEIKASLSRQVDGPVRMAYAREPVSRPRQYIPIATTNESAFLQSMDGDRRFWPVETRYVWIEKLREDRDQLWAEAVELEKLGTSIRLPVELYPASRAEQTRFSASDPFEDVLCKLESPVSLSTILDKLGIPVERRQQSHTVRISKVMHKLGWHRRRPMRAGVRENVYEKITPFDSDSFEHGPLTEVDAPEGFVPQSVVEQAEVEA